MRRIIDPDDCVREYSSLGLERAYRGNGCGCGLGFGGGSEVTPADVLGSSCLMWCRSDVGTTSSWTDRAAGHHLLQAGVPQPSIVAGGAPSGAPVYRFNGSSQYMQTAAFTLDQTWTAFVACKWTTVPGGTRYLFDGAAITTGALIANDGAFPGKATPYAGSYGPQQAYTSGQWYVWRVTFSGATSKISLDDGAVTQGAAGAANAGGFTFGASGNVAVFAAVDATEIVIASGLPTALQCSEITRLMRGYAGT